MKKLLPALAAAGLCGLTLFAGIGAAQAQITPPLAPRQHAQAHRLARMTRELKLTAEQRAQIRGIVRKTQEERRALRTAGLKGGERRTRLQELRRDMRRQVGQVLTPRQRAKARFLRREHRAELGPRTAA